MAEYELKRLEMADSGEPIEFAHGTVLENKLEGETHFDVTLKNVPRYELFNESLQDNEPVNVTMTTFADQQLEKEMVVRTVNKRDPDDNVIELESKEKNTNQ
ncbi:hypothetical protein [Pseudalkalibacillus caeni]|uniref:Uncharacterized protein n=1 Tax=Exobacillus caeni TaxID=2574798 RepID=A0A5R9FAN0_9BACL|nr:hypothetical protein [Pseudalkalibacillus caeni]TLS37604.1 hypothetical protein FCL54_10725 [Pseudalkalibacillus caeni]